jgi:flagellar motor switch protein FliM
MSDEVLSQAEVESLLTAMEAHSARGGAASETEAPVITGARPGTRLREKVVPYDFKRPERVGKDQMRALQSLHEGFGRNFSAALSALLRSIVEVKLTSVDQLTYGEFVFSLENPTCFNLLRAEPLEGNLILDINPSILYPIIDRLLGGGKDSGPVSRRPLTEIELRLVGRLTGLFMQELKRAWEGVLPLKLSVERVESNPQLVQIVPPNEVVILISFELTLGELRGMINLCIPYNAIERVSSRIAANSWVTYGKTSATPQTRAALSQRLDAAHVELVVTLAETKITTSDLIGLRVGDIITTDKDIRTALDVAVEGTTKFHASAGAFKGCKAVRIDAPPLAPPKPATAK